MPIFGRKPWVNPFEKMSVFRLFEIFVFIVYKGVFSFYNIIKDIFLAYIAWTKKLEKWPLFDQNHGLILWKNVNFLTVCTSCFRNLERRFFVLEYPKRYYPGLYFPKNKSWKNGHFWTKTMKKCQFFDCLNFLFL